MSLQRVNKKWLPFFDENKDELDKILYQVNQETKTVYPEKKYIFRSLFYFGPQKVRLVILGQDPYIGPNQACGFSFGVPRSQKIIPPSLKNIYTEISACYPELSKPEHGSLRRWVVEEKILLLNSALTVIEGKSNSHQDLWAPFTDKLIKYISENNDGTIFLLMGNFAKAKSSLIDKNKHKIFETAHPSPLSCGRFFGCKVFKKINDYLIENNKQPINWFNKN